VLGSNSVKSGGKTDITKFPSLLCPCHQARICCYFPWYLILRRMAKVESEGGEQKNPTRGTGEVLMK
jgi:hypothetical protein